VLGETNNFVPEMSIGSASGETPKIKSKKAGRKCETLVVNRKIRITVRPIKKDFKVRNNREWIWGTGRAAL